MGCRETAEQSLSQIQQNTLNGQYHNEDNETTFQFVTIDPTFTILKHEEAEEEWRRWPKLPKARKAACTKAHVDGDAINKHIENVRPILGACL